MFAWHAYAWEIIAIVAINSRNFAIFIYMRMYHSHCARDRTHGTHWYARAVMINYQSGRSSTPTRPAHTNQQPRARHTVADLCHPPFASLTTNHLEKNSHACAPPPFLPTPLQFVPPWHNSSCAHDQQHVDHTALPLKLDNCCEGCG